MSNNEKSLSRNVRIPVIALIAVAVLIAGALVCTGFVAYGVGRGAVAPAPIQESQEGQNPDMVQLTEFSMGDTIRLDADEDIQTSDDSESSFEAGFAWIRGIMDMTINSATLYDNPKAAGIPAKDIAFGSALKKPFLLIKVTLENISANPEYIEDVKHPELADETNGMYNIGFLGIPSGELCYFDGTSPKITQEEHGYYFELKQGQKKQFTLGYCVQEEDGFDNILDIGINPGKYLAYLDIKDKRHDA